MAELEIRILEAAFHVIALEHGDFAALYLESIDSLHFSRSKPVAHGARSVARPVARRD
ncbi:hypothetical protein FHR22_004003 [Sphingopyxis panaciterrae]|uniref:hypothetical protein n=1 Tax=Sphingopyxis panaciterrae TaxID=363841 RepID=UPI00141E177A|nr:hypothetical protein [Sphingopyxis panaciterrae]NIJ39256.1 hypothetical protein [Sphingopyxis panaciterrae]